MSAIDVSGKYIAGQVACPKNTPLTKANFGVAPAGPITLVDLTVLWPEMSGAFVGVRVLYNGLAILPWNDPTHFIFDNGRERVFTFDLYCAKALQLELTNTDPTLPHVIYFTAHTETPNVDQGIVPYTPPLIVVN